MTVAGSCAPPRQQLDPGQLTAQRDTGGPMVPASPLNRAGGLASGATGDLGPKPMAI